MQLRAVDQAPRNRGSPSANPGLGAARAGRLAHRLLEAPIARDPGPISALAARRPWTGPRATVDIAPRDPGPLSALAARRPWTGPRATLDPSPRLPRGDPGPGLARP